MWGGIYAVLFSISAILSYENPIKNGFPESTTKSYIKHSFSAVEFQNKIVGQEVQYTFYENKKFNMLEIINKYFETNYKNLNNYKFCIIDYELNNEEFKFLFYHSNKHDENYISFPFYNLDEINNYVFINKIVKIVIASKKEEEEEYDENFENFVLKFLGPNYNFYNDLDYFIDIQDLIKIYYFKNCNYLEDETFIKLYKENEPIIILNDKFTNKYKINKFLEWQPKINIR